MLADDVTPSFPIIGKIQLKLKWHILSPLISYIFYIYGTHIGNLAIIVTSFHYQILSGTFSETRRMLGWNCDYNTVKTTRMQAYNMYIYPRR